MLLAAGAGLVGYHAVAHSLALSLRSSAAQRAHALAPWDGRITGALSAQLLTQDAGAADRTAAAILALQALRQDATAVDAVATLGLRAQMRGDGRAAQRLLTYSQVLSRRDLRTQLWAIEVAVARGDVVGALRNYDIALRTSRSAPDLMYPVLGAAIAEPPVRAELIRMLARRPPWSGGYIDYVAGYGPDPVATAALFTGLGRIGIDVSNQAQAAVIAKLVGRGSVAQAWKYYEALHPGTPWTASRDPQFRSSGLSSFDWVPVDDPALSASIQRNGVNGVFDFAAPASVGGPLLRQVQVLPAGQYLIEGHSAGIDQPEGARPYWLLSCLADGRELGRVALPNSAEVHGRFAGRFSVPAGCPVQSLSLVARPSDMVSGVSGQIDHVQLHPAH